MASGLQCPGCGHVHPAGLPEIARGDTTFRCYGCYRTLSVPEGWTGRPSARPATPPLSPAGDVPSGAGTRDARRARLAGRSSRRDPGPEPPAGDAGASGGSWAPGGRAAGGAVSVGSGTVGDATQIVPTAGRGGGSAGDPAWTRGGGAAGGTGASPPAGAPLGRVAPRRSGQSLPTAFRAVVWAMAFSLGFVATALVLRAAGLLGVNTAIDLYAGSGLHRFGVLLVMLPMWALLSAVIAHFTLEGLARRRRPRPVVPRSTARTSTPT